MNYSQQLKHPKWQKKRLEIMKRDKFTCQLCGDEETTLNVHHVEYIDGLKAWEHPDNKLITLCEDCHKEIQKITLIGDKTIKSFKQQIKIHKSNNWKGGNRIMFVCDIAEYLSISVYDKDNSFIIGFDIKDKNELKDIVKIINYYIAPKL